MLRCIKLAALKLLHAFGVNALVMSSPWRSTRLAILCYHSISLADEHEWRPALCISRQHFLSRMELIRQRRCAVLPLSEALVRLANGSLPKRAVSITFDDGFHDFYRVAWPILREFSFPATVYLTTYYSENSRWPVFNLMLPYVLWKSRAKPLTMPNVIPEPVILDEGGCERAFGAIETYCLDRGISGSERHELLKMVCRSVGFDLEGAIRERILCLMSPEEVAEVVATGADIQLHTHRHLVFATKDRFSRDLEENRKRILRMTGITASHFCYPGNFRVPGLTEWLRDGGVESATTCDAGLASRKSDPYLLPRVLDISTVQEVEFDSWICGVSGMLPKRTYPPSLSPSQREEHADVLGKPA